MKIRYTIYKNKVWWELIYKGAPFNCVCVYTGKNRKDCQDWIKRRLQNENI